MYIFLKKMTRNVAVPLFVIMTLLNVNAAWGADKSMPEFELPGVGASSSVIRSLDFVGKVVLVNFWATWCPPCRREIPSLIRLQTENKDKGFVVIGISMDKSGKDKVATFIKKIGVNYPIGMGNNEISKSFGAQGAIPSSYLVNRNGTIVKAYPGYVTYEKMAKDVKKLLE